MRTLDVVTCAKEICNEYEIQSRECLRKNKLHLILFMFQHYHVAKFGKKYFHATFKVDSKNVVVCEEIKSIPVECLMVEKTSQLSSIDREMLKACVKLHGVCTTWYLKDCATDILEQKKNVCLQGNKVVFVLNGAKEPKSKNGVAEPDTQIWITERPENTNWVMGKHKAGYEFVAKVYDETSQFGINGGRVSKFSLCTAKPTMKVGVVAEYDRGWEVQPNTPKIKQVVKEILEYLSNIPKICD